MLCVFRGMWVGERGGRYGGVVCWAEEGEDSSWRVGIVEVKGDKNLPGDDNIEGGEVASATCLLLV